MELGEKLRLARLEAGLSQRQLCGDTITRNMLSQIEHGTARPSLDTLRILAARLGKPVSCFLEEDEQASPNGQLLAQARDACGAGSYLEARQLLARFRQPDPLLQREWNYLCWLAAMGAAEESYAQGKPVFARQLLEEAAQADRDIPMLMRQRLLLQGRLFPDCAEECVQQLPSLDGELLLRAEAALGQGEDHRALALLNAAEDQTLPLWRLLHGRVLTVQGKYEEAARSLLLAESAYPAETVPLLERCYRELGDYRNAYLYACKRR